VTSVALVLYALVLIVLVGVRSAVQRRRTGRTGLHGITGTPAQAGWWGGVLFVAAMIAGLAGPLLAATGFVVADPPVAVQVVGLMAALAGFAATLVAVQLQVRAVEEPCLCAVHGKAYETYAAGTGRFLPASAA
jgi:protein-S-isoprenylcysteine O-methyltransferase Ste14